jgi:hypothetical protein
MAWSSAATLSDDTHVGHPQNIEDGTSIPQSPTPVQAFALATVLR